MSWGLIVIKYRWTNKGQQVSVSGKEQGLSLKACKEVSIASDLAWGNVPQEQIWWELTRLCSWNQILNAVIHRQEPYIRVKKSLLRSSLCNHENICDIKGNEVWSIVHTSQFWSFIPSTPPLKKLIVFVGSLMYSPFSLNYIIIHSCGMSERRHWFADIMAVTRPPRLVYFYLPWNRCHWMTCKFKAFLSFLFSLFKPFSMLFLFLLKRCLS